LTVKNVFEEKRIKQKKKKTKKREKTSLIV